jgi:Rieske Fe-S protein
MCDDHCPLAPDAVSPSSASRREFLQRSLLGAVAAVLAASGCGDGQFGGAGLTAPTTIDQQIGIRVADYPALGSVGGIAIISGSGSNPIAVARTGTNTFVALSLICPHAGYSPLSVTSGTGFRCPNHQATFDYTGKWTGGQRTKNLQSYPTTYSSANGTLTIG